MKKIIAIIFSATFVFAGLYDYSYFTNSKQLDIPAEKELFTGSFEEIIRFEPLFFDSSTNTMLDESKEYLNEILKVYEKNKNKKMEITIIGHTDRVQSKTEKINQSWWFPTYENNLTLQSSRQIALKYATDTYKQLVKKGLTQENIKIEQRGGLDNLYARVSLEGSELNYRAMVTMYIKKDINADSDKDGVIDSKDKCIQTPLGHPVNSDGCSELLNLTVFYKVNSSIIQEASFAKLTKLIDFMNKYTDFKVLLYGHTSNEGTNLNNQILSEKRALSVRAYLIEQGISSSRISVYGKASSDPIASNDTEDGRERNRRVEIKLY